MNLLHHVEYKWLVAAVFVSGLFMDLLDMTIVNVALPTLGREFDADVSQLEWVVTAYLLSLAVWIPASGWLGDRFGTKRIFILAMVLFTIGSALCAAAWSIESLIAFRVLQGVGGGMMTPVGTAMLFRAFPPYERAKASAVLMIPIAIAPALGPVLGGVLVDNLSWHWIFLVNIPVGILAVFFARMVLEEHTEPGIGKFDYAGFALSATSLPMILYALSRAPHDGWTSAWVLGFGLTGIALLVMLVIVELRVQEPMLALRLFKDRMFRHASMINFASSAGLLGVIFLLPLFLQTLRGLSATQSGLTTFPQAIGMVIVARFAARAYPKIGPRRMLAAGMLGVTITTLLFQLVDLETNLWWIRGIMFARGMTFGIAMIPLQAATFSNISRADSGNAASLFSTNRQVASSFGVAILATVLIQQTSSALASTRAELGPAMNIAAGKAAALDGFHDAYLAGAIIAFIGFLLTFTVHDEDAEKSMSAQPGH